MDVIGMLAGAGISAGAGILAKAVGFWKDTGITERQMEERLETLKAEMKVASAALEKTKNEFNDDMKQTIAELRAVVLTVAKLQSSQDVTNLMMARSMESLVRKSELHDERILEANHRFAELQTTQSMLRTILEEMQKRP